MTPQQAQALMEWLRTAPLDAAEAGARVIAERPREQRELARRLSQLRGEGEALRLPASAEAEMLP